MTTITTLLALLVLPLGVYEVLSGHLPGGPQHWGWYRWLTAPTMIRLVALVGLGFCVFLLVQYPPRGVVDFLAGFLGLVIGCVSVLSRRRNHNHDGSRSSNLE